MSEKEWRKIYEYLIFGSNGYDHLEDLQQMITEIVRDYSGKINCDLSEQQSVREVVYQVGNETIVVFNTGSQFVVTTNEDYEDGNGLLDSVIEGFLKKNHQIKLVHLSNVLR
ncbi:hypothetical protein [Bacillus sp. Marseille-Q3570]|uniref:hypothetical protein n=1 Tax=Bacillus sp. Marseille-Q3570 TaxID=2963522 RepID=UPI0021B74BF9|nr:hypothetical protein [Bacillus sp. Marseille-Q3570]